MFVTDKPFRTSGCHDIAVMIGLSISGHGSRFCDIVLSRQYESQTDIRFAVAGYIERFSMFVRVAV
jgi:hypothetical protein